MSFRPISPTVLGANVSLKLPDTLSLGDSLKETALWAAGGTAGYFLWKKHPILGVFAGGELASCAPNLVDGQIAETFDRLLPTAGGVTGSLLYKKHPVWGYVIGMLVGSGITNIVELIK